MTDRILYAYVDGSDLSEIAPLLKERFHEFLSSRRWHSKAWLVDKTFPEDPSLTPHDLPDWNLGLNLAISEADPAGYREDLLALFHFLRDLRMESGRDFVLGRDGEDFAFIDEHPLTVDEFIRVLV